jgi:hypothetical protein
LFEGGYEVFDDFLGENRIREIVGVFHTFISQPEDVAARLVASMRSSESAD